MKTEKIIKLTLYTVENTKQNPPKLQTKELSWRGTLTCNSGAGESTARVAPQTLKFWILQIGALNLCSLKPNSAWERDEKHLTLSLQQRWTKQRWPDSISRNLQWSSIRWKRKELKESAGERLRWWAAVHQMFESWEAASTQERQQRSEPTVSSLCCYILQTGVAETPSNLWVNCRNQRTSEKYGRKHSQPITDAILPIIIVEILNYDKYFFCKHFPSIILSSFESWAYLQLKPHCYQWEQKIKQNKCAIIETYSWMTVLWSGTFCTSANPFYERA